MAIAALRVPAGFQVELWAHGLPGARMMTQGADGTVFIGIRTNVAQWRRRARRQPLRHRDQRVLRYDGPGEHMGEVPQPTDLSAAFALPTEAHHGWKFASFGPDGRLYMNVGVSATSANSTATCMR